MPYQNRPEERRQIELEKQRRREHDEQERERGKWIAGIRQAMAKLSSEHPLHQLAQLFLDWQTGKNSHAAAKMFLSGPVNPRTGEMDDAEIAELQAAIDGLATDNPLREIAQIYIQAGHH
jgi:hypothetical protein